MKTTNQKKEGINMTKNATKTIFMTTLAGTTFVGGMVSNITPILAEENKQETLVENSSNMTEEEQLMNAIHAAQNEIEQASQNLSEKEAVSKQAEVLKNQAEQVVQSSQEQINQESDAISSQTQSELEAILNQISQLEEDIAQTNIELANKQEKYDQASKDLQNATINLEDKKTQLSSLQEKLSQYGDGEALDTAFSKAQAEKQEADQRLTLAQTNLEQSNALLNQVNTDLNTKQESLNQAQSAYDLAVQRLNEKQALVDQAQKEADSYSDEASAQSHLKEAQTELTSAQNALNTSQASLSDAQNAYQAALTKQSFAQSSLNQANSELSQAQSASDQANSKWEEYTKQSEQAKENLAKKEKEVQELNLKITTAQTEVNTAQTAYDAAFESYNSLLTPKQQAQAKLEAYEKQYASQIAQLESGIKGYYESQGANTAVSILENPKGKLAGYTNIGDEKDATSFTNVKLAIDYLKQCNALRKENGLDELKVDLTLMAVAQVNANWSSATATWSSYGHSREYSTFENLSWGSKDPYKGWYYSEKAYYDFRKTYKQEHPDASNDEIIAAAKEAGKYDNTTGHYTTIVNGDLKVTGYAYVSTGFLGRCNAQEFDDSAFSRDSKVMSLEEFESSLNEYMASLEGISTEYQTLKDAVNNASDTKDDLALKEALNALNTKKTTLSNLQNQLSIKEQEEKNLSTSVQDSLKLLKNAKEAKEQAQSLVSSKEKEVNNKKTSLEEASQKVSETKVKKEKAEKDLEEAKNTVALAETKLEKCKDDIKNWQSNKEKAQVQFTQAKADLELAQTQEKTKKEILTKTQADFDQAQSAQRKAQEDFDQKSENLKTIKDEQTKKNESYQKAKEQLDAYISASESLTNTEKELDTLKENITSIQKERVKREASIQECSETIQSLSNQLKEKDKEAKVYQAINTALADVLDKDLDANLSQVEDKEIYDQLYQLACHVHGLKQSKEYLLAFSSDYQEKYAQYLEAKESLVNAEKKYNDAMKGLNEYLMKQKETKEEKEKTAQKASTKETTSTASVHTGLETEVLGSLASASLALAGLFWVSGKYRKEEK